jgi:hypothetical protein
MAEGTETSSGTIVSGPVHSYTRTASNEGGNVITEFVDAARSAAESLLDNQKRQIADSVSGMAEALRSGADGLQQSQGGVIPQYLEQAGNQIESFARTVRNKSWGELATDTEGFARHRPTWFILSAVATGFVIGRMLWSAGSNRKDPSDRSSVSRHSVAAAASCGSGAPAAQLTGNAREPVVEGATDVNWP